MFYEEHVISTSTYFREVYEMRIAKILVVIIKAADFATDSVAGQWAVGQEESFVFFNKHIKPENCNEKHLP